MPDSHDAIVEDRKSLAADHLERIQAHLDDGDAKHAPVIVTVLETLRNLLAPIEPVREPVEFEDGPTV